jgi:simple sugar transport system permease protein
MLISACVTSLAASSFGMVLGLLAGIGSAVLLSLLHWLVTQIYRIDQVISGMAINALAIGGTNFLFHKLDPDSSGHAPSLPPVAFEALACIAPFALWLYARGTRGGLRLQAVGADPDKSRLAGLQPIKIRLAALVATGLFAGMGGAMLVSYAGVYTDGMTANKGYIALAALILGGWRPLHTLAACLAFGFFMQLQIRLQGLSVLGVAPPAELWNSLPYVVTIIALAGFLGRNRTPAGLGKH